MPREYAKLRIDIWADEDWSELSESAQHLYLRLLAHPRLSKCGVTDWHPARLASKTRGSTARHVLAAAAELVERQFVVVDIDTEEILVRTHIKHDGIMRSVNGAIGVVNDYADISSPTLQAVVVHELRRLRARLPELACWSVAEPRAHRVLALLRRPSADPAALPNPFDESVLPATAFDETDENPGPPPARRRATVLPSGWRPDTALVETMRAECPDIDLPAEHRKFADYYRATGRAMVDWPATWRNWMRRSAESRTRPAGGWMTARERQHQQAAADFHIARTREQTRDIAMTAGVALLDSEAMPLTLLGNPFESTSAEWGT
ncbi:hypothetical protein OHB26_16260 [Nocardia sp. NBC_01503]|uniref:hypothetical protein n=1 Tax=Nocardia sp. NBC_01503 TaxID=2975997 RepID=UPI002E7B736B|nr:hypothetical protein [Nocardia sp. NBC_01503]WTL35604.1 hypothetical protein OHB26_16260 [Nocardia sp. NBC_01503]